MKEREKTGFRRPARESHKQPAIKRVTNCTLITYALNHPHATQHGTLTHPPFHIPIIYSDLYRPNNMSVTPMAYSTANWHWKNKTVTPWAKEWFERELVTIKVEGSDGAVVSVERVTEVDGDVELGRRKSKYVRAISLGSPSSATSRGHALSLSPRCDALRKCG
jgi:hypothetical protein